MKAAAGAGRSPHLRGEQDLSAPSRRALGGHGGQPPAPLGLGVAGRAPDHGRTHERKEDRTPTAPPPRRPEGARRAGRGRGAAEETGSNRRRRRTGSGNCRAPRPPMPHPALAGVASAAKPTWKASLPARWPPLLGASTSLPPAVVAGDPRGAHGTPRVSSSSLGGNRGAPGAPTPRPPRPARPPSLLSAGWESTREPHVPPGHACADPEERTAQAGKAPRMPAPAAGASQPRARSLPREPPPEPRTEEEGRTYWTHSRSIK
ncbi:basic salivary proline-rich protein 4-like [Symphalangus syndactylus]|uniref:basic salivary proline-rich protein 4-like n=1 Tax=Symphalangus syndactylus TaxID=9590 RepID=UPI0030051CA8